MKIHDDWVSNLSRQQKYVVRELVPKDYTMAELQSFGLSVRNINLLEDQLNVMYLNDLLILDPNDVCTKVSHLGRQFLIQIKRALEKINIECNCGRVLKNNLYGDRCEDCYAVAHRLVIRSANKNWGSSNEGVTGKRIVHTHIGE